MAWINQVEVEAQTQGNSLVDDASFLAHARVSGQWQVPDDLYPHEYAQLTCYVLQAMGHNVSLERQMFDVESDALKASGSAVTMVNTYCLMIKGGEEERLGLRGHWGDNAILADAMGNCGHQGVRLTKTRPWDRFNPARLSQYHDLGRQYRLSPEDAVKQVEAAVALMEARLLDTATVPARGMSTRRI